MDHNRLYKSIISKADEMLEEAEQESIVHGLLSLLPAGGFLDSVLFRRIRESARTRIEEFHIHFAEQLDKLDGEKLDKSFLDSDEFDVLVMKVVAKTIWEHSEETSALIMVTSQRLHLNKYKRSKRRLSLLTLVTSSLNGVVWLPSICASSALTK